jgi:transcriptional regulator with XRE-family HTH domain
VDFYRALGEVLREERHSQGLTLRQLSEKAYVSLGHISEVETARKRASIDDIVGVLVRALGCEPYEIILRTGARMAENAIPDTIEGLDQYADLVPRGR